jgi:DNA-directed RNA polymerase subunit RPC12/RpoP
MPFIFHCSQCGSILYRDPKPLLSDGSYKSPLYLEGIIKKLSGKCPSCGHKLQIPPSKIEIFAPRNENDVLNRERRMTKQIQISKAMHRSKEKTEAKHVKRYLSLGEIQSSGLR